VDPLFLEPALDLATQMIMDICGGSPSKPVIIDNLKFIPTRIDFNLSLLKKKIGIEYNKATVVNILQNLGFKLESNGGEQIILSIPSWRPDISLKDNIVGEIARIDGFEHIAAIALPMLNKFTVILDNKQSHIYRLQRFAASLGLDETVTFSFMHSVKAKLFGALSKELHIKNPISSELDYMRPSILPNLLEAAEKNQNRGINNIALFEMGSVFTGIKPEQQISSLTGLRTGFNNDRNVYKDLRAVDLFDCKADILAILAEAGLDPNKPQLVTDNLPLYYHPGRAAALTLGKNILGYFGELHPKIIQNYNLHGNAVGFELFLENIPLVKSKFGRKSALQASDYQAVERDFAFLVKEDISIDNITRSVMQIDKKLIKSIDVFDIYTGKGVENGYKSIAFSVTIQALDHTLSEQEIEDLSKKIIASVIENTNGSLRGV
jgi:phenylalanyl-tRNA synthetase beta chain